MKKLLLKNSIARSAIGMALLFLTTLCPISRADDSHRLVVGKPNTPCPNALYSTIAAAVSAASPGDEIDICPALYPEQLIITKPLRLVGVTENGVGRILLQPTLTSLAGLPFEAVITVMNTNDVSIENLAIDASNNTVVGCAVNTAGVISGSLAGIHFLNASGTVENSAIFGAQVPGGCGALFPGNGFGVEVDTDGTSAGPFQVSIEHNSLHDFGRNGVLAVGAAVRVDVDGNSISGVGPSTGAHQFGVFLALGTVGRVSGNFISQGLCGAIPAATCFDLRSEGVVLRSAGDNTVVEDNIITNVQFGFFLNRANKATIRNNVINNVSSAGSGMQLQGITNSLIAGNRISNILPIDNDVVTLEEGCGINELSLLQGAPPGSPANAGNTFRDNTINDAYCGIAHVTASTVESGTYFNTLYTTLNTDQIGMTLFPPPTEP